MEGPGEPTVILHSLNDSNGLNGGGGGGNHRVIVYLHVENNPGSPLLWRTERAAGLWERIPAIGFLCTRPSLTGVTVIAAPR
ncbi:hypothetical protein EYF80_036263 [Liparis tanakae]|uniref:Uncharacterized protein n=1 Tax=Liparis tanakae TaxID=230148 RepID=A0A4Z2GL54_9TELE|nr:hypothetical protein EYF80_036263 [Liparis tanakae]